MEMNKVHFKRKKKVNTSEQAQKNNKGNHSVLPRKNFNDSMV